MVRLSKATEQRDALDVLAATRRELRFSLDTDRPLRKGENRAQRQRVARLRADLDNKIEETMNAADRSLFRGRIAVELRLAFPDGRDDAALGPTVKAYLDLLTGTVVPDDERVDHLIVLRGPSPDDRAHAELVCLPATLLAADYDRAFRVLPQGAAAALIEQPDPDPHAFPTPAKRLWGLAPFDETSGELLAWDQGLLELIIELDEQEEEQITADPDALVDLDIPSGYDEFADWQVRESTRRHLEASTALARGDRLTDNGFDFRDRPGSPPAWAEETVQRDAADVLSLDDNRPGCFVLPAPPTQSAHGRKPSWDDQIAAVFATARSKPWSSVRFGGPLALDVAFRGNAGKHADIDNLTRRILAGFSSAFAEAEPDFTGYRAYRLNGDANDVRVRVMPAVRLEALAGAMKHARTVLRGERSERMRD